MRRPSKMWTTITMLLLLIGVLSTTLIASAADEETKYYMGAVVNTGLDNGFSGSSSIDSEDIHWNWKLGEFYVDGFTSYTTDANGDVVFLKNVGDTVTLWFDLQQDITKLNGNDKLSISSDKDGYDEYFQIPKTNFGRGALIIRHTDYQNRQHDPVIYTDFLAADASGTATVEVQFFEEGDYEIALDYEILEHKWDIFGWDPVAEYHNYRIFFKFSVRNGNCMVYPFDVGTGAELTDSSLTESGFYLDLAKSRYLDINIKKTFRTEGAEGLTEDTRFNKPAKDGEQFTDEGIYTITVYNKYTKQTTTKVIYVGTDDVLKAHVVTGLPISDIEYQLSLGATVAVDGTIVPPPEDSPEIVGPTNPSEVPTEPITSGNDNNDVVIWPFVLGGMLLAGIIITVIVVNKKKNHKRYAEIYPDPEENPDGGVEE